MNRIELIGRITKEIEIRYTANTQTAVVRFTLAVRRKGKDAGADFIPCIAYGKTAEIMDKYVSKGHKVGVSGHIQSGSYEKNGRKIYTLDVIVDEMELLEPKAKTEPPEAISEPVETAQEGFAFLDEPLPF